MKKAFAKTLTEIWLPGITLTDVKSLQIFCFPDANERIIQGCTDRGDGIEISLAKPLQLGKKYELKLQEEIYPISFRLFTATFDFEAAFHAKDAELGVRCLGECTYFSIWAPTAYQFDLLFLHQEKIQERWAMEREKNGLWQKKIEKNLHGTVYVYEISVDGEIHRVVDPYALSATLNATAGVVVDLEQLLPVPKVLLSPLQNQEKIIYEMHIRDYTIAPTSDVIRKGKYIGFTDEEPLRYLQKLGVTYVQLLPLQKFYGVDESNPACAYNWGYNPLLYFVPEGSYSTNPENPFERIVEVKELVYRLHRKQIRVILDVVYNHVYHIESHALDKIVPGYYIRTYADGTYVDSGGCGNDLATERKMVRKLIVESLLYWLEIFDVDGFRFDLMGNMDIATMQEIELQLKARKQDLLLLGEGWNLNTTLPFSEKAMLANANRLPGYAFFHDGFRDAVKGSIFDLQAKGFGTGARNQGQLALQLFTGVNHASDDETKLVSFRQSINYIECHDNHTLFDKIAICCASEPLAKRKNRQKLMTAFTLLSQGIPFLQCGQEFFRTKKGEPNTYNLCDAYNEIDWDLVQASGADIQWIQTVIQLRKRYPVFGFSDEKTLQLYGRVEKQWADGFAYAWRMPEAFDGEREMLLAFHFGEEILELDIHNWSGAEILLQMNVETTSENVGAVDEVVYMCPLSVLVLEKK